MLLKIQFFLKYHVIVQWSKCRLQFSYFKYSKLNFLFKILDIEIEKKKELITAFIKSKFFNLFV